MGVYDTIKCELKCPVTNEIDTEEIQIKFRGHESLKEFKIGDNLEFGENMSNLWIKETYPCSYCKVLMDTKYPDWRVFPPLGGVSYRPSKHDGYDGPKLEEYFHSAYINLKKGVINEVISENDFRERGLEDFLKL